MATNSKLKNQLATKKGAMDNAPAVGGTVKGLMDNPGVKKRFEEVLKEKAPQYMSSIVNLVNSDTNLKNCEGMSVIASCMVAATMDLPVDKNLGYAWVVPYGNRAQFQMGYKGYIQLALRTGQYKAINVVDVHEGELISFNPLTEELEIDFTQKKSDAIIGYAGYFKLINGFEKTVYWSRAEIETHRKKFSKSPFGWNKDFDAMARKTVLRNLLSKWGILSIDMQKAYTADNNAVKDEFINNLDVQASVDISYPEEELVENVEHMEAEIVDQE